MSDFQVMLQYLRSIENKIDGLNDKFEPRIRATESWQSQADGKIKAYSLVAVAASGFLSYVVSLFKH